MFGLSSSATSVGPPSAESRQEIHFQTEREAFDDDASHYASKFDVSQEEALRRLRIQGEFGKLREDLREDFRSIFAGTRIVHEPEYRVEVHLVSLSGPAEKLLAEFEDAHGVAVHSLEGAATSESQASENLDLIVEALDEVRGADYEGSFDEDGRGPSSGDYLVTSDPQTGVFSITVNDAAIRSIADLPKSIRHFDINLVHVEGPLVDREGSVYGGDKTTPNGGTGHCTTGFTVHNGYGTRGILTAAHCNNSRTYHIRWSGTIPMSWAVSEHNGYWGDIQWHTTNHVEKDDFHPDWSNLRDVSSVASLPGVGDYLCQFGWSTGKHCGLVADDRVAAGAHNRLVMMDYGSTADGDSGGPVFLGNKAHGIHNGKIKPGNVWLASFTPATYFDEAIGVYVAIS